MTHGQLNIDNGKLNSLSSGLDNRVVNHSLIIITITIMIIIMITMTHQEVTVVVPAHWRDARCRVQLSEPVPGVAYQVIIVMKMTTA